MTITAYPLNHGGSVEFTARQGRQALSALMTPGAGPLRSRSGFRPGGAPVVSATAATWSVGPFSAVIDTGQTSVTGPYLVASDGTVQDTMTAADATHARIDILYIQIDDTDEADGTGQRRARVLRQTGTPAATPQAPSTPPRSLLVGTINVPRVGAGAPSFTPSRLTSVAAGGLLPVFTQAERDALAVYDGLLVARMDIPAIELRSGTGWRTVWRGDTIAPHAQAAGQISFSGNVNSGAGTKVGNITFPVGRFSVAPRIVVGLANAPGGSQLLIPRSSSATAATAEVYVYNAGSTTASVSGLVIDWHAMQMQSGQASG